jgi:hypothetical protein
VTDGAAGSGSGGAGDPEDAGREPDDSIASADNPGQGAPGKASAEGPGGGQGSGDRDASSGGGQGSGDRDASSGAAGEASHGSHVGGAEHDERLAPDTGGQERAHGAYAVETPEQLLGEARKARRQARRARHAYWFPLVLFGLLTCASIPFYIQRFPAGPGFYAVTGPASYFNSSYLGGFGFLTGGYLGYYWLAAMLVGLAATAVWYRLRGDRVGLRTPSRGFVITGLVLVVLALLIPILAESGGVGPQLFLAPGDLLVRGTFPLVLIGIGLWVLAWAERSIALTVIAAGYLALALVASLYDIENVFYRLGWNLSPQASRLPNVVLPALVLLLSGAGAWVVQRRSRPRPGGLATAGSVSEVS